jgi:hypothetical protein
MLLNPNCNCNHGTQTWIARFKTENDERDSILTLRADDLESAKAKAKRFLHDVSPIILEEVRVHFNLF